MNKFMAGLIIGLIIFLVLSFRASSPPRTQDPDLNRFLWSLWDITNGRYSVDMVTTNPDGTTQGDVGDTLLLNDSGTYYIEYNVGGTTWLGEALTDTP